MRFIEYMPFDGNEWENNKMVPYREIKANIEARFGALQRCADPVTEVAKNYTLPGFQGRCVPWDQALAVWAPGSSVCLLDKSLSSSLSLCLHSAPAARPSPLPPRRLSTVRSLTAGRVWGVRRSVSFITSMTEHFCGGCNRLRVLADGNLKVRPVAPRRRCRCN